MSELQALKALSSAREADERRLAERRKAALVLILRYLADHGYVGELCRFVCLIICRNAQSRVANA